MQLTPFELIEKLLFFNFLRYLVIAAIAFFVFYILFRKRWAIKKIQHAFPKQRDYYREISYSLITVLIFSVVAFLILTEPIRGLSLRYDNLNDFGAGYWFLSIFLMLALHDTYFYWAHRLMHHKKLFKHLHLIHHKSTNPSPWAAYAFHPLEGIIEAGVIFPIIFIIPYHISAIIVFMLLMMIYNVYGHLGFELYPKGFAKNSIGKWINTSVNHNQHHKHVEGNYGLYFLFWDRWMGTLREDYELEYEEVSKKRISKK